MDALDLGYRNVTLVSDCISDMGSTPYLPDLCRRGASVSTLAALSGVVLATGGLGSRLEDSFFCSRVVPEEIAARAFNDLIDQVHWQPMMHRGGPVPRKIAVEGLIDADGTLPIYRHPADELPQPRPFSPIVDEIRWHVEVLLEQRLGCPQSLNHVLVQLYRDGEDYISEHSDKTLDIAHGISIVNVSFGGSSTMVLRAKRSASAGRTDCDKPIRAISTVTFSHNSMFVLGPDSNRRFLHAIKTDKRQAVLRLPCKTAPRVSLTFRTIATFLTPDGRLFGQGAVAKDRVEAQPVSRSSAAMLRAFGIENSNAEFDWAAHYGRGFNCINIKEDVSFGAVEDCLSGDGAESGGEGNKTDSGEVRTLYWINARGHNAPREAAAVPCQAAPSHGRTPRDPYS